MHNLRHFYYQNKEKIWKVVLIIAFLLGIIYFINNSYEKENNSNNIPAMKEQDIYSDNENKTYISDKSAISGSTITETEVNQINNTINKFLEYCKSGNAQEAYNMISADCKEEEYKSLEKFQEKYLKEKFSKDAIYQIEKWINKTYKISISEDLLATGNVNTSKRIEYITIVDENNEEKLNINSYIGSKELNKEAIQNEVKITAISKKTYMDYEVYDFIVENLSNKTIKVNSLQKAGTMYLEDSNGGTHNAYGHEIFEDELELKSKNKFNISIKYAHVYSGKTRIEKIVFEDIILDYIKYKKTENKEEFEEICNLIIDL